MTNNQNSIPLHIDPSPASLPVARLCELPDFSVIHISGLDAVTFIQGQMTNDIAGADLGVSRLAGYCTAQGRLLATLVLGHLPAIENEPPGLFGLVRHDIVEPVLKRLKMFVMRAKASLTLSSMSASGVSATAAELPRLEQILGHPLPAGAWQTQHQATGIWIAAPSATSSIVGTAAIQEPDEAPLLRWWWLSGPAQQAGNAALLQAFAAVTPAQWQAWDIEAGLPWIQAATQDLFIPQTLNLDLIGGVSFTKGCYPGQEIVARSHYRGTVKRRMAFGTIAQGIAQDSRRPGAADGQAGQTEISEVLAGADMYDRTREDQPCGRIVNVATVGTQTYILFESTFEAIDHQALSVASASGPAVTLRDLPYSTRPQV